MTKTLDELAPLIIGAFKAIGAEVTHLEVEVTEGALTEIEINTDTLGAFRYFVQQDMREHVVNTIIGQRRTNRTEWTVSIIVQKDGGMWDPPYEDEMEVASGPVLHVALFDAILMELRNRMYDSLPFVEQRIDFTNEDIPQ